MRSHLARASDPCTVSIENDQDLDRVVRTA